MDPKKKTLRKIVNKSSQTRVLIDDEWRRMRVIARLFDDLFNIDPRTFSAIHRANYYQSDEGEYAQLARSVRHFASVVKYIRVLGIDKTLNRFLKENGIEVVITVPVVIERSRRSSKKTKELDDILQSLLGTVPEDPKEIAVKLLHICEGLQSDICQMADSIKLHDAYLAKNQCEIEKPHFINAVRIMANIKRAKNEDRKNKTVAKKVSRTKQSVTSMLDSVSIFE